MLWRLLFSSSALFLDGLALGSLAGSCICFCALAADRQASTVTQTAIATQVHQPLDVHGYFRTQLTLDLVLAVDDFADVVDFSIRQLVRERVRADIQVRQNFIRPGSTDAVDVCQPDFDPFTPW